MAKKFLTVFFFGCFLIVISKGDPGRDLCKITKESGLKCSKISSHFFPYDIFLSFNDDLAQFTKKMKYLEIGNSNISILQTRSFQSMPHLSHLILSKISLTEIEPGAFEGLKKLKLVDLSHNLLQRIPIDTFKYSRINGINLNGNTILDIPTNEPILQAKFLTTLTLKNCNIQHLPGSAFQQNPALVHLDLSHNQLKMLPLEVFSSLQYLAYLDLSNNQFRTLDVKIFESIPSFPKFPSSLILSNNPWVCDCKISKLGEWATTNIKTGLFSEFPGQCRLKKLVECMKPSRISWNTLQFKEFIASC